MLSLLKFLAAAVLATVVAAAPNTRAIQSSRCRNAQLTQKNTFTVGGKDFTYTSHLCAAQSTSRGLLDPILCALLGIDCPPPAPPPPAPIPDVCGASCAISCSNVTGVLPPISDDCANIEAAITILQNEHSSTFTVDPNHLETLSFGTCSYFFENFGPKTLEYCWSDLSSQATAAGDACFPPNQPFSPEGLCTASDGTWAVGATHS